MGVVGGDRGTGRGQAGDPRAAGPHEFRYRYRALWLDTGRDSFANTGVRDATGRSGKFAGHQLEGRARYWIVPKQVRLDFGGAYLATGRFLERAPNATRQGATLYGYADVTITF